MIKQSSAAKAPASERKRGRIAVRLSHDQPSRKPLATRKGPTKLKRADDVRKRILEASLECFGAFGFDGTSTRAVAERAGVTHTLVLYHFQSKAQLWKATLQNTLDRYSSGLKQHLRSDHELSATEGLRVFIEQLVRFSAEVPQMHRILTMEGNQGTDRLQWVIDNYLRDHFNNIRDLIRRGQKEGSVRECDAARLYYHIIGAAGTPFTIPTEYKQLTGRDVFSDAEILRTIAFIYEIVFR